jgi:hypothetical protein
MSLANTAWILASNGARVLVVDWDLEAPGLHRFFHPFLPDAELRSSAGLIDFMWEFAMAALDPQVTAEPGWHYDFANIQPYAMSVEYRFPGDGTIDLVPAGRQDQLYSTQVTSFDWNNFYEKLGGGGFLQALKRNMREQYDYVLIDSRTGVSDISGICTVQMPDTLVSCFTLSTQAIDGAAAVAASVQRQRRGDQLRIFPVPMRVEDGEQDKLEASRDYARLQFGQFLWHVPEPERYWGEVEVPYKSFYAYEEILAAIGDRPQQLNTILAVTERITGYLTDQQVSALGTAPAEQERRDLLALYQRKRSTAPGASASVSVGVASRVFICYAFDSAAHFESVRELWSLLRDAGISARLDQPPAQRSPAWRDWQAAELDAADLVIVVASAAYGQPDDTGVGRLRDAYLRSPGRFIAVALPGDAEGELPAFLAGDSGRLRLSALTADGIEPLVRQISHERLAQVRSGDTPAEQGTQGRALNVPEASLITAAASLKQLVYRQWTDELASRRLLDPYPLKVRWAATGQFSLAADSERPAFADSQENLASFLLAQSRRRLVILGSPGSGKTVAAAMLAISLCENSGADAPAPVLFSAASWDPRREDLHSWLAGELQRAYPGMPRNAVGPLIEAGLVLPIIDGLDEMPFSVQADAIRQLDLGTLRSGLVLTCRTTEYATLATQTGRPLAGAAVVVLRPVSQSAAITFIRSGTISGDRRWEPVFDNIRHHPDSPVAQVLSTPLMLVLARDAYSSSAIDPADLLRFPDSASLEAHLLEDFIEAAYSPAVRYDASAARRWLTFLARGMTEDHTQDIAWWQLAKSVPSAYGFFLAFILACGALGGLAVAAIALLHVQLGLISAIGGILAPALAIPAGAASPAPRRLRLPVGSLASGEPWPLDPGAALRADRRVALLPPLVALAVSGLALLVIAVLGRGSEYLVAGGLIAACLVVVTSVLSLGLSAWGRLALARPLLASAGHLPLRVMTFLDDAYERGVLRRAGPSYQFRHARLQDVLASSAGDQEPHRSAK